MNTTAGDINYFVISRKYKHFDTEIRIHITTASPLWDLQIYFYDYLVGVQG